MCICGIHRGVNDPWRNRVETDTLARKFNLQRTCDRLQTTLCEFVRLAATPAIGWLASDAVIFTTCPNCCRRICSTVSWETWKNPERFVSVTTRNSSTVYSVKDLGIKTPALFTNRSILPKFWTAMATTCFAVS